MTYDLCIALAIGGTAAAIAATRQTTRIALAVLAIVMVAIAVLARVGVIGG